MIINLFDLLRTTNTIALPNFDLPKDAVITLTHSDPWLSGVTLIVQSETYPEVAFNEIPPCIEYPIDVVTYCPKCQFKIEPYHLHVCPNKIINKVLEALDENFNPYHPVKIINEYGPAEIPNARDTEDETKNLCD